MTDALHSTPIPGGGVALGPAACEYLDRAANLRRLALDVRGMNPQATKVLLDIRAAAEGHRRALAEQRRRDEERRADPTSAGGSPDDTGAEVGAPSRGDDVFISVSDAADQLGITERAVRMACAEGRLLGEQVAGRWLIRRRDLDEYRSTRGCR